MNMPTRFTETGSSLATPAGITAREIRTLRAGFIPLVDASVLIAAAEFGFARAEGLRLDLVKDVSGQMSAIVSLSGNSILHICCRPCP